jgi:DNA-binding response OmpR family regulator
MQWLRKAIEVDPKNPQIITTIRGIGYSLYYDEEQT